MATNSVKPPMNVKINVRCDPASPPRPPDRAISINDASDTNSQAMNSKNTSSASTSNNTEAINAVMSV